VLDITIPRKATGSALKKKIVERLERPDAIEAMKKEGFDLARALRLLPVFLFSRHRASHSLSSADRSRYMAALD
jgi:hypothetical protein